MKKIGVLVLVLTLFSICFVPVSLAAWGKEEGQQAGPGRDEVIMPKKVEIDTNADGKIDRVEIYDKNGSIKGIESDVDKDGKIDEWLYYENGKLIKAAKDSNGDGKQDTWITY